MLEKLNDIALVTQVAMFGNKRAFDQLVRKYQSTIRRFFLNQTGGDQELSDDLAQETFIKAYTHIGSFKGKANFQTWLYRIAYNTFYDYIRSTKPTDNVEDVAANSNYSTEQADVGRQMDERQALQRLKEAERTCITLCCIDGFDIKKVAEITGMPEGTVKSHLSRGKKEMANYLRQNGYGG